MYSSVVRPIPDLIHLNGFGVDGAELGLSRHWSPRGLVLPYSYRNVYDHRTVVLSVGRDWLLGQNCSNLTGQIAVQDTVRYGPVLRRPPLQDDRRGRFGILSGRFVSPPPLFLPLPFFLFLPLPLLFLSFSSSSSSHLSLFFFSLSPPYQEIFWIVSCFSLFSPLFFLFPLHISQNGSIVSIQQSFR